MKRKLTLPLLGTTIIIFILTVYSLMSPSSLLKNNRSYSEAQVVETIQTKRVWLKIASVSWLSNNAKTQIHYFNGVNTPQTSWPGVPLSFDENNDAYYYDLPNDVPDYMFTRVDINGNYLKAKTYDLKYANSINQIYTISGAISGTEEATVTGNFTTFQPLTTSRVSTFSQNLDNGNYICNYDAFLKELNYYYHGLTTFEKEQYNSLLLYDGVNGEARINYLLNHHQTLEETSASLVAKLESDKNSLTLPLTITNSLTLPEVLPLGSVVLWSSTNPDVINIHNGVAKITPQNKSIVVTLNATLKLLDETTMKTINITVEKDTDTVMVSVTWTINLPFALPSGRTLTIGSNLNDWNPSNTSWGEVNKISNTQYTYTKVFMQTDNLETIAMEYKWVLYSASDANEWYGVENAPNNQNRQVTISFANETQSFTNTISSFENISNGSSTPTGRGTLTVTQVGGRTIRIYTPPGYNASNTSLKYPVIYMHDGQNLFDASTSFSGEWEVDETIERLMSELNWGGAIAVGIDNTNNRMGEYMYPTNYISYAQTTPVGDIYMNLIVNTIKPYIDNNYNTLSDRANTLLGGSSMGGLISFFGGLHHLDTFGTLLAFSSSTQLVSNPSTNIPNTLNSLNQNLLKNTKFFLYVGTSSDGDRNWPATYQGYLLNAGVTSTNIQTYIGQGHSHNEYAWRVHLPIALKWAFGYGL